mmetsp:Transcript_145465/g.253835  ORF Transcript_145465/g.253835 Transcript_145465/m.253835 type:complete len:115 (-) Transcript_145465:13-357(-)
MVVVGTGSFAETYRAAERAVAFRRWHAVTAGPSEIDGAPKSGRKQSMFSRTERSDRTVNSHAGRRRSSTLTTATTAGTKSGNQKRSRASTYDQFRKERKTTLGSLDFKEIADRT